MGLLEALTRIGELEIEQKYSDIGEGPLKEVYEYASPISDPARTLVVRVWLDATDPQAVPLEVRGVAKIDVIDMDTMDLKTLIRKMPYIPSNANSTYQLMPMLLIGKPKPKSLREESGKLKGRNFSDIVKKKRDKSGAEKLEVEKSYKNMLVPKLFRRVLLDLENEGFLVSDSSEKIYTGLLTEGIYETLESIASNMSSKKKSAGDPDGVMRKDQVVILFGVKDHNGNFLYPTEVRAFYEFALHVFPKLVRVYKTGQMCSVCGLNPAVHKLSDVLKFATVDKPGFLPLFREEFASIYVCEKCYKKIKRGIEYVSNRLSINDLLSGVDVWVVPEVIGGDKDTLADVLYRIERLFGEEMTGTTSGKERKLWSRLAEVGSSMVFHLVFVRSVQAKLEVRAVIEDVPPSRLARLGELYETIRRSVFGDTGVSYGKKIDALLIDI